MAKEVGFAYTVAVDDGTPSAQTISNDVTDFDFSTPRGVKLVTGVDSSQEERLLLLADFSATMRGVFNSASNRAHDVFKTVPSQAATIFRTLTLTINSKVMAVETYATDYALTRGTDGSLVWTVPFVLQDGAVAWA